MGISIYLNLEILVIVVEQVAATESKTNKPHGLKRILHSDLTRAKKTTRVYHMHKLNTRR